MVATQYLDSIDDAAAQEASADAAGAARVRATWLAQQEAQLRREEKTFTADPATSDDAMSFVDWLETFHIADHAEETSRLLQEHPGLLKFHIKLVPDALSNEVFWTRYFWHCKKIHLDADRRAALVERAAHEAEENEEEGWGEWDDDLTETALPGNKQGPGPASEIAAPQSSEASVESPAVDWGYDSPVSILISHRPFS